MITREIDNAIEGVLVLLYEARNKMASGHLSDQEWDGIGGTFADVEQFASGMQEWLAFKGLAVPRNRPGYVHPVSTFAHNNCESRIDGTVQGMEVRVG